MSPSAKTVYLVFSTAIALQCLSWAAKVENKQLFITVRLYSDVQLSSKTLRESEQEVTRILQHAGVGTAWIDCRGTLPVPPECDALPGPKDLTIRIVPKALSAADSIFGMAFLSKAGAGAYSDVFYDSLEKLRRECGASESALLGHVVAHELGHLLLGSGAHTSIGIMRPRWYGQQLRAIERGSLFFTSEQAELIRTRLKTM